jgi:hypothetical protein
MLTFDQAYLYQFVLFTDEQAEPTADAITRLPDVVSRPVAGTKSFGLKLAQVQPEQSMVIVSTGATANGLTWRSASGFWRLTWSPTRIDVQFDARGYAEALEEPDVVTLTNIRGRLMPNLVELPNVVGQVNRLALVVTAKSIYSAGQKQPSPIVAATFFNADLIATAQRGELLDAIGRANHAAMWPLGSYGEVRVNRNETGTASWAIQNGVEQRSLSWQFDLNTHPQGKSFASDSITTFFESADMWITQRLKALQEKA